MPWKEEEAAETRDQDTPLSPAGELVSQTSLHFHQLPNQELPTGGL